MNILTSIFFDDESILKIIRALDVNKAYGHDDISIQIIKLCNKSHSRFAFTNFYQIQFTKSQFCVYQFLVKFLKRFFFNSLFEFLHENNVLNENQPGFRPSDSC